METAQPEIGLALIESMMETVDDPELLQTYEEKRRLLLLEIEIKSLNRALQYFVSEYDRAPVSIEELMRAMGSRDPND